MQDRKTAKVKQNVGVVKLDKPLSTPTLIPEKQELTPQPLTFQLPKFTPFPLSSITNLTSH